MSVTDHLTQVPLFRGMTQSALEAVAGLAAETQFADGDEMTREGDEGDAFYVIVDGQLVVSQNGMTVRNMGPGDFLGEISLIDGRPRTATATAAGPVKALVIRRPEFRADGPRRGPPRRAHGPDRASPKRRKRPVRLRPERGVRQARPRVSRARPQCRIRTAMRTPNAASTRMAAAAIDASRSPPRNSP